jgi:citrate synthase
MSATEPIHTLADLAGWSFSGVGLAVIGHPIAHSLSPVIQNAALAELKARRPDRVLATNVEFWSAVVLDYAQVPANLFTPMFASARVAGWSAHILEQKREGRLIRPTAEYIGPGPRSPDEV